MQPSESIQCVTDVVRPGRLRWFGYLEGNSEDNLETYNRNMEVMDGGEMSGQGRKTWGDNNNNNNLVW